MVRVRLVWLDNLKSLLIILVVLGHCIQMTIPDFQSDILFRYIYSFHMPLFIFVSGYASFKNNVEWSIISRRFIQLIIPFIIWTCISSRFNYDLFCEVIYKPEKGLWFLWTLFFITSFHILIVKVAKFIHIKEEIVISLVTILFLGSINKFHLFAYPIISKFFLFYILGYYARKKLSKEIAHEKQIAIFSFLIYLICAYFCMQGQPPSFMPVDSSLLYNKFYNTFVSLVAIIAFILIFRNLFDKQMGLISTMGKEKTLGIYAIHRLIISAFPIDLIIYDNKAFYYFEISILCLIVVSLSYLAVTLFDMNSISALLLNGHNNFKFNKYA